MERSTILSLGKSTISMAMFNSELSNHKRVYNQMEVSIQSHVVPQARWMVYESWKILAMIAMNG